MTDITDEQIRAWAADASKYAATGWLARAAEDHPGILRRFAELARQDELMACIAACDAEHLSDPHDTPDDEAYDMAIDDCVRALRRRSRGTK